MLNEHIIGKCSVLFRRLFFQFFGYEAQLVVPFLSELLYEWFAQEAVDGHVEFLSERDGTLADVPAVVAESAHSVSECAYTDGIKCA